MKPIEQFQARFTLARVPEVDFAAIATNVDRFCSTHINNVVDFLDKHPGIAMMLSPQTVLRHCAQKHAERQIGYGISRCNSHD